VDKRSLGAAASVQFFKFAQQQISGAGFPIGPATSREEASSSSDCFLSDEVHSAITTPSPACVITLG